MKSALPKVLHPLLGRSMVGHVLAAAGALAAQRTLVVVGHGADQVSEHLAEVAPGAEPVRQEQQLGTGHAVRISLPPDVTGTVVVLNGDLPLITAGTLTALVQRHERGGSAATLLTAEVADPGGLGRIVAGEHGFERIVEERDANPAEREIREMRALLRDRVNTGWMLAGVSIIDPATTWVDVTVELARDVVVEPNTQLRGGTAIGAGAVVGPDTTLTDVYVGPGASVVRTHGSASRIGPCASVGPYAYLRPGTVLGEKGKIGTFVETKNAEIGAGTKVPHLSYVGDATIGEHTNIGAATVFVNYDGVKKHRTVIGSHARTGADNMFVAPVEIGDGAYTGAGTVVRRNVPPGALSVSGGPQRTFEGWVEQRRPGTAAAAAAHEARHAASGEEAETPGNAGGAGFQPPATGDTSDG